MVFTIFTFIVILSILIIVHELGHFMAARFFGVQVDEFGFGLPPRIFGRKIRGTLYSLNWLPFGGFVKLAGEDEEDRDREGGMKKSAKDSKKYFWAKSRGQRACILLAGVTMNFLLAVAITGFLLTRGVTEPTKTVHIEKVTSESPAFDAGLLASDIIASVSFIESGVLRTKQLENPNTLIDTVKMHAGETVTLSIVREGKEFSVNVIPRKNPPEGEGPLGVTVTNLVKKKYPPAQAPFLAVKINSIRVWQMLSSLGGLIAKLITGKQIASGEVSGPIGIAQVTGEAVKYGWEAVLEFMGILSLNLALLNILPFPALDGGRLAFVIADKFGKKARPAVERAIHQIGMIILLALILLITVNDILRIVRG